MKRALFTLFVTIIAAMVLLSFPLASASLSISVHVAKTGIAPFETQQITADANERGEGILIVIQPAIGAQWEDFLNANPNLKAAFLALPSNIQEEIDDAVGDRIVSYTFVNMWVAGGGPPQVFAFPNQFTGVNGVPSTGLLGKYKVLFAYASLEGSWCDLFEADFACDSWNVIPEVPLGAATAGLSLIAAAAFTVYKKRRVTP